MIHEFDHDAEQSRCTEPRDGVRGDNRRSVAPGRGLSGSVQLQCILHAGRVVGTILVGCRGPARRIHCFKFGVCTVVYPEPLEAPEFLP